MDDYYYSYEETIEMQLNEKDQLLESIAKNMESVDFYIEPFHNSTLAKETINICSHDIHVQILFLSISSVIMLGQFGICMLYRRRKYKQLIRHEPLVTNTYI